MIVAPLDATQSVYSPSLKRHIFFDRDWPLLVADFLDADRWLLGIPEPLLDTCRKESAHFTMADNTFCRVLENGISKIPYCPSWDRKSVYARFHRGLGHLKFDSIIDLVTRRYWWPTMKQDIKKYISECPECQLDQSASGRHAPTPIRPIPSVALPFERWGMDFVQDLPRTKSGNQHIITAIDYATRWVVAKAVPNRDSVTVASFLYELMMNYGSPFELLRIEEVRLSLKESGSTRNYRGFGIMPPLPTTHRPTEWSSACMPRWAMQLPRSLRVVQIGGTNICNDGICIASPQACSPPSNLLSTALWCNTLDYQVTMDPSKKPWQPLDDVELMLN
ncbi:hypothetical protein BASA81_017979 [Batrachochytrium salamandrivorans]|nr:hypothetical protein BASA81_017979 [Batrachochytrium salamandrivorans]